MRNLETHVAAEGITLLCCAAQPEVEIYACAGFRNDVQEAWEEVRRHPRMKEEVFDPLLARHGDPGRPGAGRDLMIARSLGNRCCSSFVRNLRRLRDRIQRSFKNGMFGHEYPGA